MASRFGPGDYTYDPSTDLLSVSFSGATDLTLPGAYSIFPASAKLLRQLLRQPRALDARKPNCQRHG